MSDRKYDDAIHAPRIWHAGNAPRGWAEEHRFAPYVRADLVPTWQPMERATGGFTASTRVDLVAVQDTPRAMAGPTEALHVAMGAIFSDPWWMRRPDLALIGEAMKATGGAVDPRRIAEQLRIARLDRGLVPPAPPQEPPHE